MKLFTLAGMALVGLASLVAAAPVIDDKAVAWPNQTGNSVDSAHTCKEGHHHCGIDSLTLYVCKGGKYDKEDTQCLHGCRNSVEDGQGHCNPLPVNTNSIIVPRHAVSDDTSAYSLGQRSATDRCIYSSTRCTPDKLAVEVCDIDGCWKKLWNCLDEGKPCEINNAGRADCYAMTSSASSLDQRSAPPMVEISTRSDGNNTVNQACATAGWFTCGFDGVYEGVLVCSVSNVWIWSATCGPMEEPYAHCTLGPNHTAFCTGRALLGEDSSEKSVSNTEPTAELSTRDWEPKLNLACPTPGWYACGIYGPDEVIVVCSALGTWEFSAVCGPHPRTGGLKHCRNGPDHTAFCVGRAALSKRTETAVKSVSNTELTAELSTINNDPIHFPTDGEPCGIPGQYTCGITPGLAEVILVCSATYTWAESAFCGWFNGDFRYCKWGPQPNTVYCSGFPHAAKATETAVQSVSTRDESLANVDLAARHTLDNCRWPGIQRVCTVGSTVGGYLFDVLMECDKNHNYAVKEVCGPHSSDKIVFCHTGPNYTAWCVPGSPTPDVNPDEIVIQSISEPAEANVDHVAPEPTADLAVRKEPQLTDSMREVIGEGGILVDQDTNMDPDCFDGNWGCIFLKVKNNLWSVAAFCAANRKWEVKSLCCIRNTSDVPECCFMENARAVCHRPKLFEVTSALPTTPTTFVTSASSAPEVSAWPTESA